MPTVFAGENVVINADLLRYAAVETDSEGLHVRLGFADEGSELRLSGLEARAMLRWLRLNVEPMDSHGRLRDHRTEGSTTAPAVGRNPVVRLRFVAEPVATTS